MNRKVFFAVATAVLVSVLISGCQEINEQYREYHDITQANKDYSLEPSFNADQTKCIAPGKGPVKVEKIRTKKGSIDFGESFSIAPIIRIF